MAVELEYLSFIVPIGTIEKKYPGGWVQCLADHERRQLAISRQGRVRTQQVDIEGSVNCP